MSRPPVKAERAPPQKEINRDLLMRRVLEAHFTGLVHLVRQLDSGMLSAKDQEVHVKIIRMLEHIKSYEMPKLFEKLGIVEKPNESPAAAEGRHRPDQPKLP